MDESSSTAVFIVGGGPVGLAMSLQLAQLGIDSVLIEQKPTTSTVPKARGVMTRSMENFRQWGIEPQIKARAKTGIPDMAVVESVTGREYGRSRPEPDLGQSPTWKTMVAQEVVEEELARALAGYPEARIFFSTEFVSYDQDDNGVRVTTRSVESGATQEWTARYLIAADGAGSRVRKHAEIEMIGPDKLAISFSQSWRCDTSKLDPDRSREVAAFYIVAEPQHQPAGMNVVANDALDDRWVSVLTTNVETTGQERPISEADTVEIIRRQVGIPNLPVELLSHSTFRWTSQIAATYRQGRMFLVGDAAHRFPATGGFGLNTGFQDVHNLAWKLAFVLNGQAPDTLLDTYESERRPVAQSNADWSVGNQPRLDKSAASRSKYPPIIGAVYSGDMDRLGFWLRDLENHLHSNGRALGFSYEDGVVIPDGTVGEPLNSRYYTPTDRPGSRFPHMWLDLSQSRSTLDWFERDFALVTGPLGTDWLDAGATVSEKLGLPLGLHSLPSLDPDGGFEMGMRGAVLVRPDGHVAWRTGWMATDPAQELGEALSTLLEL